MLNYKTRNARVSIRSQVAHRSTDGTPFKRSATSGRFFLLALLLSVSTFGLFAQDVIIKKDGTEIKATITEVGTNEIKYTRFGETLPVYTLLKSEIFMIKYENGAKDMFHQEATSQEDNTHTQLGNPQQTTYKYTFGNAINPVGGAKSAWGVGIASFFIPGLGQFINGDVGGGFLFLGANLVSNYVWRSAITTGYGNQVSIEEGQFVIGFISAVAVNICSVVNAVQIAKRVNMARGYTRPKQAYFEIQPALIPQKSILANNDYAYGMHLKINF